MKEFVETIENILEKISVETGNYSEETYKTQSQ